MLGCLAVATPAQELSHAELVEVLDLRSWRIPMPRDTNLEWSVTLEEAKPRKVISTGSSAWMHPTEQALITFRPDRDDTYRFTLKQRGGMSSGTMEITPCAVEDADATPCRDQFTIEWHKVPVRIDDGAHYLLADVESTFGEGRKKQLVLRLAKVRP